MAFPGNCKHGTQALKASPRETLRHWFSTLATTGINWEDGKQNTDPRSQSPRLWCEKSEVQPGGDSFASQVILMCIQGGEPPSMLVGSLGTPLQWW